MAAGRPRSVLGSRAAPRARSWETPITAHPRAVGACGPYGAAGHLSYSRGCGAVGTALPAPCPPQLPTATRQQSAAQGGRAHGTPGLAPLEQRAQLLPDLPGRVLRRFFLPLGTSKIGTVQGGSFTSRSKACLMCPRSGSGVAGGN